MDLACTIDERICDGYYLIKTLKTIENYIKDPEMIEPVTHSDDEEEAKAGSFRRKKNQDNGIKQEFVI